MGTEHELSVNDAGLHPLPIVDRIIEGIHGTVENEIPFGGVNLSKELQKNVIEIVPAVPQTSVADMERALYDGMLRFHQATTGRYTLLGLGMHPLLTLDQTSIWDHEDRQIYEVYDRLFDLRQHGWLNIQALQINVHYGNEARMVSMFNRLRALTPYLVALTASSPFVEGRATGAMDNRLLYYRKNQQRVPAICNNVIPEKLRSRAHHDEIIESIYRGLRAIGGEDLCHEWIDSRGVIVRYHRECLELKACDEQECLRSDMAVTAFVLALLRADLDLEEDHDALLAANEASIKGGTASCRAELMRLYDSASNVATSEERAYLPLIERRIEEGSLAELMAARVRDGETIHEVAGSMVRCLRDNIPARAD
ncbi:MAG: glutamate-cysteine ligase family protein [Methanomassiliicoccus sp.]|nr:glutamate-cysteine ligase family protein [Methanomassiliicoccus sp.]